MVSYPSSVWDGDSAHRDSDEGMQSAPDYQDWFRAILEVAAAQTRVDRNIVGTDSDATHTVGAVTTKSGLSVVESGDGAVHKTVITFDEMAMVSTDGAIVASDGAWGTQKLYTFPEGYIQILGAYAVFPITKIAATLGGLVGFKTTSNFELGVGTVAAANAAAFDLDGATEEDIIAALVVDLTSKTSDAEEAGALTSVTPFDGTTTAKELHLNFRTSADADHGPLDDILTVSGTLTIVWTILGDD